MSIVASLFSVCVRVCICVCVCVWDSEWALSAGLTRSRCFFHWNMTVYFGHLGWLTSRPAVLEARLGQVDVACVKSFTNNSSRWVCELCASASYKERIGRAVCKNHYGAFSPSSSECLEGRFFECLTPLSGGRLSADELHTGFKRATAKPAVLVWFFVNPQFVVHLYSYELNLLFWHWLSWRCFSFSS